MDEARIVTTGEVITAEDLYFIENVKSQRFCCDECEVPLVPCSYIKDINLKKPYFKTFKDAAHKTGCDAEGTAKTKKKGLQSRLTTKEGFPLPYPNRFKLRKDDTSEPYASGRSQVSTKSSNQNEPQSEDSIRTTKLNHETTSFKRIVNEYFDFPYDRDRELFFEGIKANIYDNAFARIKNTLGKQHFHLQGEAKKIYYSTISWKMAVVSNDVVKIELSSGKWVGNKIERPYYVEIDMSDWPKQTKTKFQNRYKIVLETIRGTNNKAVIAFVGNQDVSDDYFRFFVVDRLLIAFKLFHDV